MYKIIFVDGTTFTSATVNSKWNEMPNKKIKQFIYGLQDKCVILEGFESYNHVAEIASFLMARGGGILKVLLMGKFKGKVHQLVIDLKENKMKKVITPFGEEYMEKPTTGWKEGAPAETPSMKLTNTLKI